MGNAWSAAAAKWVVVDGVVSASAAFRQWRRVGRRRASSLLSGPFKIKRLGQGRSRPQSGRGVRTLFFAVRQARSILARWVDAHDTERPHSSLGYAAPAAFAGEPEKQGAGLNSPVAPTALVRESTGRSLVAGR